MAHPTTLNKLFSQSNEELGTMVTKAKALVRLSGRLRRILDGPLAEHCGVANVRSGELVLYATSSAWAAKLRYAGPQIRATLAPDLGMEADALRIKIRVIPPAQTEETTLEAHPPRVSADSARMLQEAAESVEDQELGEALKRLARHSESE